MGNFAEVMALLNEQEEICRQLGDGNALRGCLANQQAVSQAQALAAQA
jgi:hypothetical protein